MSKRRNQDTGFKARVALEALKGERTVSDLAAEYGVHPTMIHQWKKALLEGWGSDIFERGGNKKAEVAEETVRLLHAKIEEMAVANFFVQNAQALDRQVRRRMIERHYPTLSVGAQLHLLSIARSSFYYAPHGETEMNLALMPLIDRHFL